MSIKVQGAQGPSHLTKDTATDKSPRSMLKRSQWWFLVILYVSFLLVGQTAATLLGRFYYDQGGNSKWMSTLVQIAGFPFLFIPRILFRSHPNTEAAAMVLHPPIVKIAAIYIALGLILGVDDLMYSYGLLYIPVSTYSLVCATQLAFNAVFSYLLNSQRFTALIFNAVVLLTFAAALLGIDSEADGGSTDILPKGKYALGFILTLGASAGYALILSLMQLTFEKVLKSETLSVVLDMQIWTSFVATCVAVVGLFASGESKTLNMEFQTFKTGRASYIMTLVFTGISWQIASVGVVGLVHVVSSLFSNVISTLALPVVPIFAVIFFHDKMNGLKVIALLIAVWGSASYIYQQYLDDSKAKKAASDARGLPHASV